MRLLVVCRGNTCRSPMLAAYLKIRLPYAEVESAGVKGKEGRKACLSAREAMATRNIDISEHRTRSLANVDIDIHSFDMIVTVDVWARDQIQLAGFAGRLEHLPMPNPYGKHQRIYENVADRLDEESARIARTMFALPFIEPIQIEGPTAKETSA